MMALASFACGLLFGLGLTLSGMTQPAKVLGFLDVLGAWDPTLAFVMASALAVTGIGFALVRRSQPVLAPQCQWPTRTGLDRNLVAGSLLFGAGWGLVGLCPGPALANLATLSVPVIIFVIAMAAGMMLHDLWQRRAPAARAPSGAAVAAASDG